MTVEELAVAAKMSTGNISAIENRRQGYSHDGLNKLARALKTTTGALLSVNPLEANTKDFWPIWERLGPNDRETLRIMAERLAESTRKS